MPHLQKKNNIKRVFRWLKKPTAGDSFAAPYGPGLVDSQGVLRGVQTAQAAHVPQHWARGALKIRNSATEDKNYSHIDKLQNYPHLIIFHGEI